MRGEQFQLLGFALFIEDLNGCKPACLRGVVQLAEVAQSLLTRTIGRAHGFDQRPIGVFLAVLLATVRPQKHSELILSWYRFAFKTVGLHYIAVWERTLESMGLACREAGKNAWNYRSRDELGLTANWK